MLLHAEPAGFCVRLHRGVSQLRVRCLRGQQRHEEAYVRFGNARSLAGAHTRPDARSHARIKVLDHSACLRGFGECD